MPFKFIPIVVSVIFLALLWTMPAAARASMVQPVWIDGHRYDAHLERNQRFVATEGEHYEGFFPDDPGSWVRISRLDKGWEGMAYAFGRMHTIGGGERPATFSFSQIEEPPQCGLDHLHGQALITPDSLIGPAMAQAVSANYDTLCADKVDGACLMLELELAFDKQFQDRFAKPKERAGAILNMVEGFYKDQFGIIFDTLSLTFLDSAQDGLFSNTTEAGDLLSDVRDKRAADSIGFLQSDQSIFHFISGRDFNGSTAGVAYVGTLCGGSGYASGVTNALSDNAVTALIVAHEIGHNLGASHDVTQRSECPQNEYIMSPNVGRNVSSFSSCSYESVTSKISSLGTVEQCFNFPADVSLLAANGNPAEVDQGATFQANFRIDYQDAALEKADRIAVGGVIGEGEGRLLGVSFNGNPCTLTGANADGFNCAGVSARTGLILSIEAEAGTLPTFNLLQNATLISNSGEVKDIQPWNNELMTQIALAEIEPIMPEEPGNGGTATETTNNSGSGSGSSNGGGGAVHWMWLLVGALAVASRRRLFK
ncbi:Metallo-peptidase family M12 [Marinobacter antarcticus]|uniref:Metallo-peptidase family M12 n=1 Tax=Marinobacter antarcticus TaxID=564117 RepID=A0A1M6QY34_9GAMM|nr:M12 family metallo-peptidase [Marinobacter antarcticus]SHK24977.1 Metallo-peptidase family M12 [Marinobacter antarcticus]